MRGSCKCGAIKYNSGDPVRILNCHCNLCRSINGSAFSSYVVTRLPEFKIEAGNDLLASYTVTDHAIKHFCSTCGTPIYNSNPQRYPGLAMIYLGTAEAHEKRNAEINIYCSSKLEWVDNIPSLHSFAEAPQRN